jgi:hypothetical protein
MSLNRSVASRTSISEQLYCSYQINFIDRENITVVTKQTQERTEMTT